MPTNLVDLNDLGRLTEFESDSMQAITVSKDKNRDAEELPLNRAPVMLSVLNSDGLVSKRYRVNVTNGNAYINVGHGGRNSEHVSLHESRDQYVKFPATKTKPSGYGPRWSEPDQLGSMAVPSYRLLFPTWGHWQESFADRASRVDHELMIVGHRSKKVVIGFFILDGRRVPSPSDAHLVIGRVPVRKGKVLYMVAWKEPQDVLADAVRNSIPKLESVLDPSLRGDFILNLYGPPCQDRPTSSAYGLSLPVAIQHRDK